MKHEFVKALHQRYQKEGIIIPFPIRTLDIPTDTLAELTGRRQNGSSCPPRLIHFIAF